MKRTSLWSFLCASFVFGLGTSSVSHSGESPYVEWRMLASEGEMTLLIMNLDGKGLSSDIRDAGFPDANVFHVSDAFRPEFELHFPVVGFCSFVMFDGYRPIWVERPERDAMSNLFPVLLLSRYENSVEHPQPDVEMSSLSWSRAIELLRHSLTLGEGDLSFSFVRQMMASSPSLAMQGGGFGPQFPFLLRVLRSHPISVEEARKAIGATSGLDDELVNFAVVVALWSGSSGLMHEVILEANKGPGIEAGALENEIFFQLAKGDGEWGLDFLGAPMQWFSDRCSYEGEQGSLGLYESNDAAWTIIMANTNKVASHGVACLMKKGDVANASDLLSWFSDDRRRVEILHGAAAVFSFSGKRDARQTMAWERLASEFTLAGPDNMRLTALLALPPVE